ncbi:MAG TPA: DUF5683 domain-containing protein [Mucilaginibacter sp.]|jgi:hypothetical protein|nr:DUF5683 domain-containing protein [Mucilaginibacter sp.]
MYRYLLIIGLLIGFAFSAVAQNPDMRSKKSRADSIQAKKDSLKSKPFVPKMTDEKIYHPDSTHSPHKAVMHSLIIPGWGQVYNHRWWKVPLVYAALGSLGFLYVRNTGYYKEDLAVAKYYEKGEQPKPTDPYYDTYQLYKKYGVDPTTVNQAVKADARNRDLCAFGFIAFWGIQAIDAYIDAKFMHSFSMDSNFTMKIGPDMTPPPMYAQNFNGSLIPGLKVTFTLK